MRDADQELRTGIHLPRAERRLERRRRLALPLARLTTHRLGHTGVRRTALRSEDELATRILLQDVVDHLRDRRLTHGRAVDPFIAPSDRRTEGRTPRQNLAFGFQ